MIDPLVKRLRTSLSMLAQEEAADRIEELEDKLAKAEWLLVDAAVQLEEGKIKTRRNRAALIRQFLAELTGGKDGQA